jgi:hypothetical protein
MILSVRDLSRSHAFDEASPQHDDVQTDSCCRWRGPGGGRGRRVFHAQGERGRAAVPVGGPGAGNVEGLPPANLAYICAENEQEYRISFTADAGAGVRQGFGLTGYWCNNLVVETLSHGTTRDRIDRDCALLAAVRRLLPARATATQEGACAHANARLFLAVSRTPRHGTPGHGTLRPKTPTHKTSTQKAPTHKTPTEGAHAQDAHRRREPDPRTHAQDVHAQDAGARGAATRDGEARGSGTRDVGTQGSGTRDSGTPDVKKVVTAPTQR